MGTHTMQTKILNLPHYLTNSKWSAVSTASSLEILELFYFIRTNLLLHPNTPKWVQFQKVVNIQQDQVKRNIVQKAYVTHRGKAQKESTDPFSLYLKMVKNESFACPTFWGPHFEK